MTTPATEAAAAANKPGMKPGKYSNRLCRLYAASARFIFPAQSGPGRRILCATPIQHLPAFSADTEELASEPGHIWTYCGRPGRNRRLTVFVFSDASVIIHIQRAAKFACGARCVLFNRFALTGDAVNMLGMMLNAPEIQGLRNSAPISPLPAPRSLP